MLLFCLIKLGISEKRAVPPKTMAVPNQWKMVNGFWKYHILKSSEMNLRRVTTKVTVNEEHSVVKTNTALIQMDLKQDTIS